MLYSPYPSTWPKFSPRDKIATWLEHYAEAHDLVVWTSTEIETRPTFDEATHRWSLKLLRDGNITELHPFHVVLATGTLGDPYMPSIPSLLNFSGTVIHASRYNGAASFTGKRVLVVGSGTTAADIIQDLHARSALQVTMVQRSPTCVVSRALADQEFRAWPEGASIDVCDFRVAGMPLGLAGNIAESEIEQRRREDWDRELRDGLKKRGFLFEDGPHGGGRRELVYDRLGGKKLFLSANAECAYAELGYWIDVGAAGLIIDGEVKVKAGVEISMFDLNGSDIHFTDGSKLSAEVVIFAYVYFFRQ